MSVRKFSLQLQGTGRRIDLIVDADQLAGIDNRRSVIAKDIDSSAPFAAACIHADDCCCGKAELHSDRLQLRNDDKSRDIGRVDDVALIDLTQTGAARKRRNDLGVAERRLALSIAA